MEETNKNVNGTFCWIELGTSDTNAAKKFYSDLFKWNVSEIPFGDQRTYNMMSLEEKEVAGCYQLTSEQKEHNVPPHWLPYISVENTDDTTKKAKNLQGKALLESVQVMDMGKLSILEDTVGATFAVWQALKESAPMAKNIPNTFCWAELGTTDIDSSKEFYSNLVGWGINEDNFEGMDYYTFKRGPISEGGMYKMPDDMKDIPPHWLVYFNVDDCDAAVEKAKSLGAKVLSEPVSLERVGRFSVLQDPQGAVFAVIKLEMPDL